MRITEGKIYKTEEAYENWMWLELTDSDGVKGYGEISTAPGLSLVLAGVTSSIIESLLNNEIEENDLIGFAVKCFENTDVEPMFLSMAQSGISQAMEDIASKRASMPLYRYLGGTENTVDLYANINRALRKNRNDAALFANVENAVKSGFKRVKIAPLDSLTPMTTEKSFVNNDVEHAAIRIEKVSDIVGEGNLAVDCHQRFNGSSLIAFLDKLEKEDLKLLYIEDVLTYTLPNFGFINRIKKDYDYIYAAGETCYSLKEVKEVVESGCFEVYNPDVKFVGPIQTYLEACKYVVERGGLLLPHNPTSPIATAFSAAIISAMKKDSELEFAFGNQAFRNEFIGEEENVVGGKYILSNSSGIGFAPSESFLKKYCYVLTESKWVKL